MLAGFLFFRGIKTCTDSHNKRLSGIVGENRINSFFCFLNQPENFNLSQTGETLINLLLPESILDYFELGQAESR